MKISIICPLYNAEDYIEDLYLNIKKQKDKIYFNGIKR